MFHQSLSICLFLTRNFFFSKNFFKIYFKRTKTAPSYVYRLIREIYAIEEDEDEIF